MKELLCGNGWMARLVRTEIQGVIAVVVANLDFLVGQCVLDSEWRVFIVALVMAVLSPAMAALGDCVEDPRPGTGVE